MEFEPFTITLCDDGELFEQAHVRPDLTMLTSEVRGAKEPPHIIDTEYILRIAEAINSAVAANVELCRFLPRMKI